MPRQYGGKGHFTCINLKNIIDASRDICTQPNHLDSILPNLHHVFALYKSQAEYCRYLQNDILSRTPIPLSNMQHTMLLRRPLALTARYFPEKDVSKTPTRSRSKLVPTVSLLRPDNRLEPEKFLQAEDVTTHNKALEAPYVANVHEKRYTQIVAKVVTEKDVPFDAVSFEKFKAKSGNILTSDVYTHYHMLIHKNTLPHPGWALYNVLVSGRCSLEKGCQTFDHNNFTTNLIRHQKSQNEEHGSQSHHRRKLGRNAKSKISPAACLATFQNLRPFSFAEGAIHFGRI